MPASYILFPIPARINKTIDITAKTQGKTLPYLDTQISENKAAIISGIISAPIMEAIIVNGLKSFVTVRV